MAKQINFKDVQIGDYFYFVEDGNSCDFKKVSDTEAALNGGEVLTDFSPGYLVDCYPASVEQPEFLVYYDAQGHEHAEF